MITSFEVLLELHEGRRARPYRDSVGNLTIGVGRCLETKPLSDGEINFLRDNDARDALHACLAIFGAAFVNFADARQAALKDMAFNIGETGLRAFVGMRAAIERGDWDAAAGAALQSKWAEQVPSRAAMDAEMLRTGAWPKE